MSRSNRRLHKRLRVDKSVRVPVQIFPILPFLGEEVSAKLHNLSLGGLSLILHKEDVQGPLKKGTRLKIHIRLAKEPLRECLALVASHSDWDESHIQVGLKFEDLPAALHRMISKMVHDDEFSRQKLEFSLQTAVPSNNDL